jgi:hypothetical protein
MEATGLAFTGWDKSTIARELEIPVHVQLVPQLFVRGMLTLTAETSRAGNICRVRGSCEYC